LCGLQAASEGGLVHVVGEGLPAADLDDGDQLAIGGLELLVTVDRDLPEVESELVVQGAHLRERPLAEVAAVRVVDDDSRATDRGHA